MAEKDTAAAAKAAVGRPKAAVGRQRAAHRLRLAAAAQPRPPKRLKIDSLAYNWLIRLLSRTHAQAVNCQSVFVIVRTIMHRHLGTVGYNGDQIQQRNGLGLVWIRSILGTGAKNVCWSLLLTACFLPMRTQYLLTRPRPPQRLSSRFRSPLSTRTITTDIERAVYVT